MKIVFLSYLHGFGGAERQNILLANAMASKGHDVTMISIAADNKFYELDSDIDYRYLPDRKKGILRLLTRYNDILNELKVIRPDITINFWFQSAYLTAFMKKSVVGKVIYSERGDPGDKEYKGLLGLIRIVTLPRIDGFVFQSRGAQSYFNERVQKKSIVIPNPVFVKKNDYPEVSKRRKVIVTIGRLHEQKNQKLLIEAFSLVASKLLEYNLEIYGDGPLKDQLEQLIETKKLQDRVLLMGTSSNIHEKIYDAALFVLSSTYEGLPNTLIEAMALGIPCISTDCKPGGAREIIHHQEDGIIVSLNDEKELAEAIIWMIENSDQAEIMGEKAAQSMLKFNPKEIFERWERFLIKFSKKNGK